MTDSETAANHIASVLRRWDQIHFEMLLIRREQLKRNYLCNKLNRFLPYKLALFLAIHWPEKKLPNWDKVISSCLLEY